MPIRNTSLTITHPAEPKPPFGSGAPEHTVTLSKVLVQENTPGEDTSSYDDMTQLLNLTIHVMTPDTPLGEDGQPIIVMGDTFTWNGRDYAVTSVGNQIMPANRVAFLPYAWRFYAKARTR